ncbi:Conserved hypothetical protein [gamma proteobacterium HdN1]|nr:Conserved hypothetical protein [gamma proteobacterium HdN1]
MALALVLALESTPEGIEVRFDIGKNRYLRWQLGGEETLTRNGLPALADVKRRSEMIGPLGPEKMGRGEFRIPASEITRESRWLQISSYREPDGSGPAISAVSELPATADFLMRDGEREMYQTTPPTQELPPPEYITRATRMNATSMNTIPVAATQQVDNVPFRLRERRLSEPMFLQAILGALPNLLPMLAPAIGSLISGAAPAVGQAAGNLLRSLPAPDASAQTAISSLGALAEQVLRALGPAAQQILTPENIRQVMQLVQAGNNVQPPSPSGSQTRAQSLSRTHVQYSQAQVAPALLAALPALMPLLQQVLSPQTIQSVIDAPQRMTGQIINGITDFARLGLQADQQLNEHLRALNPGVDDAALHQLLAGMSLGMATPRHRNYKRVSSVQLQVEDVRTQVIAGRETALYQHGVALQFPLSVATPQTINDAELMIQVKQADTLRIVHEASEALGTVGNGPIEIIPRIEAQICASLAPHRDYIVVLTLLWKNAKRQLRGTSIQHSIHLMSEYQFDRVEESSDLIALSNRETWRDYWHQIWETTFDRETRRVDLQTRYYLTLNPERSRNARMDTDVRSEQEGPRETLRIKSGYQYSLYSLNHLITRLAPDQAVLEDKLLSALASPSFVERFNQAARHQGQIRGRPGQTASLWVFPEFKLQTLILVRANEANEHGNIGSLGEERVQFPMPAMLHFVGVIQA